MTATTTKRRHTRENHTHLRRRPRFNFWRRLKDIDMFFQGKDAVHQTARRAVRRLERAGISYAIAGGMAVNAHHYRRTTVGVDLLLNRRGFERFCELFVGRFYDRVPGRGRRFIDRKNHVSIDILITGLYPGTGKPGPIAFPEPTDVSEVIDKAKILDLATLVELKLAAHRYRDFGDVVELIRFNSLDESFAKKLHSSVRRDYLECLDEKRREDEYESRDN